MSVQVSFTLKHSFFTPLLFLQTRQNYKNVVGIWEQLLLFENIKVFWLSLMHPGHNPYMSRKVNVTNYCLFCSNNNNWGQLFTVDTIWNIGETGDIYSHLSKRSTARGPDPWFNGGGTTKVGPWKSLLFTESFLQDVAYICMKITKTSF